MQVSPSQKRVKSSIDQSIQPSASTPHLHHPAFPARGCVPCLLVSRRTLDPKVGVASCNRRLACHPVRTATAGAGDPALPGPEADRALLPAGCDCLPATGPSLAIPYFGAAALHLVFPGLIHLDKSSERFAAPVVGKSLAIYRPGSLQPAGVDDNIGRGFDQLRDYRSDH